MYMHRMVFARKLKLQLKSSEIWEGLNEPPLFVLDNRLRKRLRHIKHKNRETNK